jgi:outer membrane protein TolC
VRIAEENLRIRRLKVTAGELAPVESTRLEAALVQSQAAALDSNNASRSASDRLLVLMGEDSGQVILPATTVSDVPALDIDAHQAVEVALAQNLDVAVDRTELANAKLDARIARPATLPSLSASLITGISARPRCASDPTREDDRDCDIDPVTATDGMAGLVQTDERFGNTTVSANFSMPLGNRASRGDRDRTASVVHGRELALQETERSVTSSVQASVRELNSARNKVDLADLNARLMTETLASEEALAESGRRIQKDVLEARKNLDQAKADAAKARTDFQLALIELRKLQGQLDGTE